MKSADAPGILWIVLGLMLLLGAGAERLHLAPPADTSEYHRQVRDAAAQIPLRFGNWTGTDVPLDYDVTRALHPNVMICRDYRQAGTGQEVWLLLVQCENAVDLGGHYPPICYPNIGYTLTSTEPRTWQCGTLRVSGADFTFSHDGSDSASAITVSSFMELPDGTTTSDMEQVFIAGAEMQTRYYGAAEAQLLFAADVPRAQRDQTISEFLSAMRGTIQAIGSRANRAPIAAVSR
jgi:Protein of unknown function (DUF3485)